MWLSCVFSQSVVLATVSKRVAVRLRYIMFERSGILFFSVATVNGLILPDAKYCVRSQLGTPYADRTEAVDRSNLEAFSSG